MNDDTKNKIKYHFIDNKNVYIAACVGVLVGATGAIIASQYSTAGAQIVQKVTQFGFRNESNPVIINLIERSTASKPVHLVGTNLYFNSINEAARETGHHLRDISKCVNGLIPDVKGDVFELLEPAV
jgi:hypothetical protein